MGCGATTDSEVFATEIDAEELLCGITAVAFEYLRGTRIAARKGKLCRSDLRSLATNLGGRNSPSRQLHEEEPKLPQ